MTARKPKPQRGGARPGAGRPRTRPDGARKVQVVLSPAAAAAWAERDGDRSAWVSALIEQAAYSAGPTSNSRIEDRALKPSAIST